MRLASRINYFKPRALFWVSVAIPILCLLQHKLFHSLSTLHSAVMWYWTISDALRHFAAPEYYRAHSKFLTHTTNVSIHIIFHMRAPPAHAQLHQLPAANKSAAAARANHFRSIKIAQISCQ